MSRKPIEVSSRKTWNALRFVDCWDTFWFNPRLVSDINLIRVAIAAAASVYALTWLTSLGSWVADDGLLSRSQAEFLIGRGVEGTGSEGRISPLFSYIPSSFAWAYVLTTSVACMIVSLGVGGRLLAAAAWVLLLGLVHRIPMIQGPGDFLITGLFGYLVICPGTRLKRFLGDRSSSNDKASWTCNLAIRLIQCHVFLWFAASLASHLAEPIWWTGTAPWWLSFSGDQSWVSIRFWLDHAYIMNGVCYLVLGFHAWILVSFLVPTWRKSGVVAMSAFAFLNFVIAHDWVYSLAIAACVPVLLASPTGKEAEAITGTDPKSGIPIRQPGTV